MSIPLQAIDDGRLARQALQRLAQQEAELEAADAAAEEARKQKFAAEVRAQQAQKDDIAIAQLAELKPLYVRRKELGEKAAAALAEFCQVEEQIKIGLAGIDLSPWAGTPPNHSHERREALRQRAGLSRWHWIVELRPMQGVANRQALVALAAIARGFLTESGIRVHAAFQSIDADGV